MSSILPPEYSEGMLPDTLDPGTGTGFRDGDDAHLLLSACEAREEVARTLAAEQAARAGAERARIAELFHEAPVAIATWRGPQHVFEFANPRYEQIVGRKDLVGRALRDVLPELEGQGVFDIYDGVYSTGERFFSAEMSVMLDRHGSGKQEEGVFSFTLEPIREKGRVSGLMVIAVDVTEQIRARRDQIETEQRLRLAMESAEIGIWDFNPVSGHLDWDARCKALAGLPPEASVDFEMFLSGVHPGDRDRVKHEIEGALDPASNGEYGSEYRSIGIEDRVTRWIAAQGRTFFEAGRAVRFIGTRRDITARKSAERELLQGAKRAQLGAEIGAVMAGRSALDEQLRRCAQAIVSNLDAAIARIWTLDEATQTLVLRASMGLYTHLDGPHSRVPVGSLKIGLIARERRPHLSNDVLTDDYVGDKAWAAREGMVAFAGYPLIVDDRVVGVMAMFSRSPLGLQTLHSLAYVADAIAVGIDRKSSEEQLRKSEQRYRSVIEATAKTIWTTSPEGEMRGEQPEWAALTGQTSEEVQGHGWLSAIHPEDRPRTLALWQAAVSSGEVFIREHRVRRRDGEWRYFSANSAPVREEDGSIREWFGVQTDVTEKKLVEVERELLIAALKRSNEDLDQFAYVTSHDLKAPLRGIANLSQWVEEDLADKISDEGREHMRLLRGRVNRLEALINGILSYSRAGRTQDRPESVDVGKLVREVIELLAPVKEVSLVISEDLPTIQTERVPLQQVLLNLISNAIKYAAKTDPRVIVTCSDTGDGYSFMVRDNGSGIAPEFHKRIWVIFQTLEPRDKVEATGIGLSIVKKIVESRGGRVWIDSGIGAGAAFHFFWPKRAKASS